jgi:arylformamidase
MPLSKDTTVWPGDPRFELVPLGRIAKGDSCNTSRLIMATHTGTHIDAPWHFEENGKRLDEVDSNLFFGEATVIDLPDVSAITAARLGKGPLPARVLFKTRNSAVPTQGPFHEDFVAIARDAAERLADEHVRLVGVDYLSVGPFKNGGDTHHVLLRNDIICIEGLRLALVPARVCQFVVLPLPLVGADGGPCRAFAGLEVGEEIAG